MAHIMMDLESWGTRPGCALRSIGAVVFDPHSDSLGDEFYSNIDDRSCQDIGLTIDPETVQWWAQQSPEAVEHLKRDQRSIKVVVSAFHNWFREGGCTHVWCHGANFDEPLWQAVAQRLGLAVPWKFWNVRCTRTIYEAANFDPRSLPREGAHHNALDDAKHQARCVQAAYRMRRNVGSAIYGPG